MKVKEILAIGLIGILITISTGCSAKENKLAHDVVDTVKNKAKNFAEEKWKNLEDWATEDDGVKLYDVDTNAQIAYDEAMNVIKCFKAKNIDGVKKLFCPYVKEKHEDELGTDIEACLNLINGEIISYDEPDIQRNSWETDEDGIVKLGEDVTIENICTESGKKYCISFSSYVVNKNNPEGKGIIDLKVYDMEAYTEENSFPEDANAEVWYEDVFDKIINN